MLKNCEKALHQHKQEKQFNMRTIKNNLFAMGIDCFLWSYILLVSFKIIYEKIFLNLRYSVFTWNGPLYALGTGAIISLLFFTFNNMSLGRAALGLYPQEVCEVSWKKKPLSYFLIALLMATFLAGIRISQISVVEFFSEQGMAGARRIFTALLNPNFAILESGLFAAVETVYMAFMATSLALPLAFIMSFFAARNLMIHNRFFFALYSVTRFYLNITRSIEPLVWAIIFSVWVGIGPFAGMLALCLHSVASLAKLYSEQIENINKGPMEAMMATGAHPLQVIWYGVVPQIILPFLSFTIYRWDINVRMATVIGLVGGGGIGTMLMQYQGLGQWSEVGLLVMIIAIIVWAMDYASAKLRELMV